MNIKDGLSMRGVHNLVYKDDACEFAREIREELLRYPGWIEMRQDSYHAEDIFQPHSQNGITTRHLTDRHDDMLPHCIRFRNLLHDNSRELCDIVGVKSAERLQVEMNAMAYGEGGWLSPHTDSPVSDESDERLVAWMLYLTHPEDGEWSEDKGGAIRLWVPGGEEVRLRPKLNRFAIFKVCEESFHEIEKVTWKPGWERCRLALSGWIRGSRTTPEKRTSVYMKSADYIKARADVEATLQGSLALYQLMVQQREYCGVDTSDTMSQIAQLREDYKDHLASPDGTRFLRRIPGPEWCIFVLDKDGKIVYFGPSAEYKNESRKGI